MSGIQSISVASTPSYASVGTQSQQSLQPFANLDLTEAQRASLRAIFTNAKKTGESQADVTKQIDAVLSPAQQQTLAGDINAGQGAGSDGQRTPPFANLQLTAAQSASLKTILANAKATGESQADVQKQINAILTTAQQQTLASDIKAGPPRPPQTSSTSDASTTAASSDSSSTSSNSAESTTLAAVTNIQNQAAAAHSARINALLAQVLATTTATTNTNQ